MADEAELGFVLAGEVKKQLALRGRLVAAKKAREEGEGSPYVPIDAGGFPADHPSTEEIPLQGMHGPLFPPTPPEEFLP